MNEQNKQRNNYWNYEAHALLTSSWDAWSLSTHSGIAHSPSLRDALSLSTHSGIAHNLKRCMVIVYSLRHCSQRQEKHGHCLLTQALLTTSRDTWSLSAHSGIAHNLKRCTVIVYSFRHCSQPQEMHGHCLLI